MSLPPGDTGRAPTRDDADEIAAVIHACNLADTGESEYRVEDLLEEWASIDIARDAYVVTIGDTVVAYTSLFHRGNGVFDVDGYVHPEHTGRGIGSYLLRLAEVWVRQRFAEVPDDLQIVLNHGIDQGNAAAQHLFQVEGFGLKRQYYRMIIELAVAPPEPEWPEGLYVRSFVPGQDASSWWKKGIKA
jgi:mycothiol synthase